MKKIVLIAAVVAIIVIGGVGYAFLKPPEEASAPIEAIPVVVKDDDQTEAKAGEVVVAEPTATEVSPTPEQQPAETVAVMTDAEATDEVEAATEIAESTESVNAETEASTSDDNAETDASVDTAEVTEAGSEESSTASSPTVFQIIPTESEARFIIGEILRGAPFTVVGVTNQVAAEFLVDAGDLSTAQIGPVLVNARTLETDNGYRNRAIKNRILTTDQHEFINFTPTELTGLTGSGSIGESYSFQIAGDLTIRDVTKQVIFDASATAISGSQIEGFASTLR